MNAQLAPIKPKAADAEVQRIQACIRIDDQAYVSDFGRSQIGTETHQEVMQYLENSDIAVLGRLMQAELQKYQVQPPPRAVKPGLKRRFRTAYNRFMGYDITDSLVRLGHGTTASTSTRPQDAERLVERIQAFIANADRLDRQLMEEALMTDAHIAAGKAYLAEHPTAGLPAAGAVEFLNQRGRFERRLGSLEALYVSHLMSVSQLRLAKSQAIDICDRFQEMRDVLLPVLRQQKLALANKQFLDPAVNRLAIEAHETVTRSIAATLNGLPDESHPKN